VFVAAGVETDGDAGDDRRRPVVGPGHEEAGHQPVGVATPEHAEDLRRVAGGIAPGLGRDTHILGRNVRAGEPAAGHRRPDPVGAGREGETDPGHDHQDDRGDEQQPEQAVPGRRVATPSWPEPVASRSGQIADRQPEPGERRRTHDPGPRQAEERVEQEAAMEAADQAHVAAVMVPGAIDAGTGGIQVDLALPHLDDIDAVADGGRRENPHLLARVVLADDRQRLGRAPVARSVPGQFRVTPVLDRIAEEKDEPAQALERHPQAEHGDQWPVDAPRTMAQPGRGLVLLA
jgi:hypothetical protein